MKEQIMLPIYQKYIEKIMSGEKKYEFRRNVPKKEISVIFLYSTFPVKKVVGKCMIKGIIKASPDKLWEMVKDYAGLDKKVFDDYFKNRQVAYAYEIAEAKLFKNPKSLESMGVNSVPQNFCYMNDRLNIKCENAYFSNEEI